MNTNSDICPRFSLQRCHLDSYLLCSGLRDSNLLTCNWVSKLPVVHQRSTESDMPRTISSPASKKPLPTTRRVKAKPAWSDYLTEDNRFALTKEEVLKRKQALLSKNNVFNGNAKTSGSQSYSYNGRVKASQNSERFTGSNYRRSANVARSNGAGDESDDSSVSRRQSGNLTALDLVSRKQTNWYVAQLGHVKTYLGKQFIRFS